MLGRKYPNGTVFGSYSGAVVSFIGVESTPLEISLLVTALTPTLLLLLNSL
jgi:hypothetical protein